MATSNIQQNLVPNDVTLKDVLDLYKKNMLLDLFCHHIGTVQSFNGATQTATATINYKKTYFLPDSTGNYVPQLVDYPILMDCPVICLGGGNTSLTFPIAAGDECLVLFNDRDMDNWFQGGAGAALATPRLHSFSDGIILVGVRSSGKVLQSYDTVRAVLQNGTTLVGVNTSKVKVANATYTLNGLLQNLMTQLTDLTTALSTLTVTGVLTGGATSGPPSNAAAITSIGTQISTIATEIGTLLE
jgi:hypothetical protein